MSFSDAFHDYIDDVPMEISRKFYPTRNINVDIIDIPEKLIFSNLDYSFEAESRAREQFDKQNEPIVLGSTTSSASSSGTTTASEVKSSECKTPYHDFLSQNVLVPCPVSSNPSMVSTKPATPNTVSLPHSLHEFESTNNVFDDMQILALDDKKALQEVLMLTNSNSSAQPQSSNSTTSIANVPINNNHVKPQVPSSPPVHKPEKSGKDHEELKKRLLTKGYRSDIVEKTLTSLPKNRLVHIEYYMKACRTLEKTGRCPIDESLPFLIQSNLSDKMIILNYSDVSAKIIKMGFSCQKTFEAVAAENGDEIKALNRLLPSS